MASCYGALTGLAVAPPLAAVGSYMEWCAAQPDSLCCRGGSGAFILGVRGPFCSDWAGGFNAGCGGGCRWQAAARQRGRPTRQRSWSSETAGGAASRLKPAADAATRD